MKRWLWLLVLMLPALPAWAQMTLVNATVQDSAGTLYVNCSWTAVFVGQNTTPGAGPYQPAPLLVGQQGNCDSSARLSVTLADNVNTVRPLPSQWNFSICSQPYTNPAATYCRSNMLVTISGATQDLTQFFAAQMPTLPTQGGGGGGTGFITDATPLGGLMRTGTTLGMQTTCTIGQNLAWSGSAWVCANPGAGTGGGTSVLINNVAPIPNSLNFNSTAPLPPAGSSIVQWLLNGNNVLGYITGGGGGGGGSLTVNGGTGGTDLNDALPPIPPNGLNISWRAANGHISGALVGDGIATHCFLGTGVFALCPGGSGGGGGTLPSTTDVLAGNGAGGAVATGVQAASGHVQAQVIRTTGAVAATPFSGPAATMEYFPTGAIFPPSSTNYGAANGFTALFSHSNVTGATGNGGVGLAGGNVSGTAYQVYLDCEVAGCDFKVPPTLNGGPIGGGGGTGLPATTSIIAGNGSGGGVATGVNGSQGFLQGFVLTAIGTANPSPFTQPNASLEYYPVGAYGISTPNGLAMLFSHSSVSGTSGNGAIGLAGGNASGVGTSYQPYVVCQTTGCDFKVQPTYLGAGLGGGSMTWPSGVAGSIPNYSGSSSWGTSYNATNPIPANFVPIVNQLANGTRTTPAIGFASAPELGFFAGPTQNSGGTLTGFQITSISRTSNVVSAVMTLGAPGIPVGTTITVSGVLDTSYNGVFVVATTGATMTWNQTGANSTSTGGLVSGWMFQASGYGLQFSHLVSNSNGTALRGSIRLGSADPIIYGCAACTVSTVTGFNSTDQNLLTSQGATGPVKLGDYQGVQIYGPLTTTMTGGPYCVQQTNGVLSSTAAACGTGSGGGGGSGTVSTGAANQIAYYQNAGTTVSGNSRLTDDGATLTYSGASGGHFTGNLTVDGLLSLRGPFLFSSILPTTPMGPAPAGQSSIGVSNDGNFYISANATSPSMICTAANGSCGATGTTPTGTGLVTVTSGVQNAAATAVGNGLSLSGTPQTLAVATGGGITASGGALTTVGQQPYEIAVTVNSTFTASQVFLRKPTSLAYTIPAGCPNSQVTLGTAPTAAFVLSLQKNGTQFASVSISTAGVASWTCTAATSFVVGTDVLTIVAPATADTTAANFGGSFYATR